MKVLADTSIWIEHFRHTDAQLVDLLDHGNVVIHPFVIGELLLGGVWTRDKRLMAAARSLQLDANLE